MAYPIFPYSPLPANLNRTWDWGENNIRYDNGEQQSDSPFIKPLLRWTVPIPLMTEARQPAVKDFQNATKGMTRPFLMKDAYDYQVASVLGVRSGITDNATLYLFDVNSYMVRPDTLTISSMFSALSGYVRMGHEYSIEQDTGIVLITTKDVTDVWGVRSLEYFRKCKFDKPYSETSKLWNIFGATLEVVELP